MSAAVPSPPRLDQLPPEELERRAREHLDAMWSELRAAGQEVRAHYHPLRIAARHPFAAAALAGAAVALGIRALSRAARSTAPGGDTRPECLGRSFTRSLLGGLAAAVGRALSDILPHDRKGNDPAPPRAGCSP